MIWSYFVSMVWLAGVFISPETLLLHGNSAGLAGGSGLLIIMALAIGLHGANGTALLSRGPLVPDEIQRLTKFYGSWGAAVWLMLARPGTAILLSTALLVTAGFVFNENFIYWFPNFGFAGLMLGLILFVNLLGANVSRLFQAICSGIALISLGALFFLGFWHSSMGEYAAPKLPERHLEPFVLAVAAFVGYDLLPYIRTRLPALRMRRHILLGLSMTGGLLLIWNYIGVLRVPPQQLAVSTIPHYLIARALSNLYGRELMSLVSIFGCLAAVNYFYRGVASQMVKMSQKRLLPPIFGWLPQRQPVPLILMAGVSGLLMAAGFAGSDWLDISLRASLLLWLVYYGGVHLSCAFNKHAHQNNTDSTSLVAIRLTHLILLLLIAGVVAAAIWTAENPVRLISALSFLAGIGASTAIFMLLLARRWPIKSN